MVKTVDPRAYAAICCAIDTPIESWRRNGYQAIMQIAWLPAVHVRATRWDVYEGDRRAYILNPAR